MPKWKFLFRVCSCALFHGLIFPFFFSFFFFLVLGLVFFGGGGGCVGVGGGLQNRRFLAWITKN